MSAPYQDKGQRRETPPLEDRLALDFGVEVFDFKHHS